MGTLLPMQPLPQPQQHKQQHSQKKKLVVLVLLVEMPVLLVVMGVLLVESLFHLSSRQQCNIMIDMVDSSVFCLVRCLLH